MSQKLLNNERVWSALNAGRGILSRESYYLSLFLAHMALRHKTIPEKVAEDNLFCTETKLVVSRLLSEINNNGSLFIFARVWMQKLSDDEIIDLVIDVNPLSFVGRADTGDISCSVLPIMTEIMKRTNPKICMDFCSGVGNAMILMAQNGAEAVYGVEINQSLSDISYLRLSVLKDRIESFEFYIFNKDVFIFSELNREKKYDFIFSEFPWGVRSFDDSPMTKWHDEQNTLPQISRNSDWKFIALANDHLENVGKAILVTPASISFKQSDNDIRTHFIKKGYIEQVIRLPEKLLEYTGIPPFLMVLSRENKKIRFFDANSVYKTDGRRRFLPEKEIPRFFCKNDSNMVVKPILEVLEENRLDPAYHVASVRFDGQQLQDLADVTRAKPIRKAELDKLLSENATDVEFVRPKHINSGIISADEFLKEVPTNISVLHHEDVLISRVGSKIVCAVYVSYPGLEAVADENLYVVRCNQEKLNPYYLLAYLQSELGSKNLAARYEGVLISRISIDALKKLPIPSVPIVEQNAIGNEMKEFLLKTKRLRLELETIQEKIDDQLADWFKG